jgi:LmbE family N-acetylglucosaminyl deacetylase
MAHEPVQGAYDCLYVAARPEDALFSCAARMLRDRAAGRKLLLALVFSCPGPAAEEASAALARIGVDRVRLGLPPAPERSPRYASYEGACFSSDPADDELRRRVATTLNDIALKARPRDVLLPFGAGGHADRRLCHEAALLAFEEPRACSLLLYEERPEVLLPGTVLARLADLGARLPPGAARIGDGATPLAALWSLQRAPHMGAAVSGLRERLRVGRALVARQLRARGYDPLRAFGLRLQPVVERAKPEVAERALATIVGCEAALAAAFGSRACLEERLARYARRLACDGYVERCWLVLPEREAGGIGRVREDALQG